MQKEIILPILFAYGFIIYLIFNWQHNLFLLETLHLHILNPLENCTRSLLKRFVQFLREHSRRYTLEEVYKPFIYLLKLIEKFIEKCETLAKSHPWKTIAAICAFMGIVLGSWADLVQIGLAPSIPSIPTMTSVPTMTPIPTMTPVPTMQGNIRVAVAGFSTGGSIELENMANDLGEEVFYKLEKIFGVLELDFTITVWGPKLVGQVEGDSVQEREDSAQTIADRVNANVVIYGIVEFEDSVWSVQPEFYILRSFTDEDSINKNPFADADEIAGSYKLGSPFYLQTQDLLFVEAGNIFASRSTILSTIIVGLWYYTERMYESALAYFQTIDNDILWKNTQGREILYLFIGNCQGRLNKLVLAQEAFETSISIDNEYARAYVGLANIYYLRALQPVSNTQEFAKIDLILLEKSEKTYKKALNSSNQPSLADIKAKVHFGLGQVHLAKSLADSTVTVQQAITEFMTVIDIYANGENPRIEELASESYARLGLIYEAAEKYEQAVNAYEQASEVLSHNKEKQKIYISRAKENERKLNAAQEK